MGGNEVRALAKITSSIKSWRDPVVQVVGKICYKRNPAHWTDTGLLQNISESSFYTSIRVFNFAITGAGMIFRTPDFQMLLFSEFF